MSSTSRTPLVNRIVAQPLLQAAIIFFFGVILTLIDKGSSVKGIGTTGQNSAWILMTACILFYTVACSVLSLKAKQPNKYWRDAILSLIGLMVGSALVATLVSGLSMDEAGSFRWLFVVLAIGFLVFLSIVRLMKKIVDIAIKQDDRLRGE